MRRELVAAVALLSLASCSTPERPEGIVERWLISLGQGSAGEPERYARRDVSDVMLRAVGSAEPDAFDVIEVGRATPCGYRGSEACTASVPFRVVGLDGDELRLDALVGSRVREGPNRVFAVTGPDRRPRLPSEGGPPIGAAGAPAWVAAVGVGLGLALASETLMRWSGERRARLAPPHRG